MSKFLLVLDVFHHGKRIGMLDLQEQATDFLPRLGENIWLPDAHPIRQFLNLSPSYIGATVENVSYWVRDPKSTDESASCMITARIDGELMSFFNPHQLSAAPGWLAAD